MCFGPELAGVASAIGSAASAAAPYAGAALTAGSIYANQRAAHAQQQAQANALEAERERQQGIQKQSDTAIQQAVSQFDPGVQQQNLANAQAARTGAMTSAIQPVPTDNYQTTTASAPTEVKSDLGRQVAQALANAKTSATRQATLQGFGDATLQNNINLGHAGERVGQLARNSQSSAALVPLDLAAAHSAGGDWAGAGDILGHGANLANLYSFTRNRRPPASAANPAGVVQGLYGGEY